MVDLLSHRPLNLLALALCLCLATGCGLFGRGRPETRAGASPQGAGREEASAGARTTERTAVAAPGERRLPDQADAGAGSPRRRASEGLVEEGKGYYIAGLNTEARERFQQAIRLDGSNGAAYYYLAQIAADESEWEAAEGYLDRAAALLRGREEYREPLEGLAERIADRR